MNSSADSPNVFSVAALPIRLGDITRMEVWNFYRVALHERETAGYAREHLEKLFDVKCGLGRLLTDQRYYVQQYCQPFATAVHDTFRAAVNPRILDVCCGTGSQAIFFAFLGASVVAIDLDEAQLETFRHRIEFYERMTGKSLDIELRQVDVMTADFESLGRFDAVYSHGGIGGLESAENVFRRLSPILNPGGIIALKNGNPQCLWLKLAGLSPRDSPSREYQEAAARHGFRVKRMEGTTGVPRQLWKLGASAEYLSRGLRRLRFCQLGISYSFQKDVAASL